jgi:hypothetical protein
MTTRKRLDLTVYAPTLVGHDGRTLAVVHGMERALPGLRLEWKVSPAGKPIGLPQRDAWLVEGTKGGGFPLVCNGDEAYPVTVTGWGRPARLGPGGQPQLQVQATLPLDAAVIAAAAEMLECVAEGARAFWGHATPDGTALAIAEQTAPTLKGPPSPPRGLPALKLFEHISRARRTATGGWVVQLTDAPLDLDNPAHLDALKRAYERFPEIGGRLAR